MVTSEGQVLVRHGRHQRTWVHMKERNVVGRGESVGLYTVYIRDPGGLGRGGLGLRNVISPVIHTSIRQSHGVGYSASLGYEYRCICVYTWSRRVGNLLYFYCCLLWISKTKVKDKMYMSVGVMKDYKLKLRKLHSSHTLGCPLNWNT